MGPSKVKPFVPKKKKLDSPSGSESMSDDESVKKPSRKNTKANDQVQDKPRAKTTMKEGIVRFDTTKLVQGIIGVKAPSLAEKLKANQHMSGGFDDSDNLEQMEEFVNEQIGHAEEKFSAKLKLANQMM